jgi:hypothetical protein
VDNCGSGRKDRAGRAMKPRAQPRHDPVGKSSPHHTREERRSGGPPEIRTPPTRLKWADDRGEAGRSRHELDGGSAVAGIARLPTLTTSRLAIARVT